MRVELSDEARRLVALFEDEAAVAVRDCVVDEDHDQVVIWSRGQMADAIGPGGQTVERVEERLGREVKLVEAAETAEDFGLTRSRRLRCTTSPSRRTTTPLPTSKWHRRTAEPRSAVKGVTSMPPGNWPAALRDRRHRTDLSRATLIVRRFKAGLENNRRSVVGVTETSDASSRTRRYRCVRFRSRRRTSAGVR